MKILKNFPKFEQPVKTPEQVTSPIEADETKTEQVIEQKPETATEKQAETALPTAPVSKTTTSQATDTQEQTQLKQVESILSAGLDNIFLTMDSATQVRFKAKGEETTQKINTLINSGKIRLKKVIELIIEWLRIIPKVNAYFLEQEAKIKADAIMKMYGKK